MKSNFQTKHEQICLKLQDHDSNLFSLIFTFNTNLKKFMPMVLIFTKRRQFQSSHSITKPTVHKEQFLIWIRLMYG